VVYSPAKTILGYIELGDVTHGGREIVSRVSIRRRVVHIRGDRHRAARKRRMLRLRLRGRQAQVGRPARRRQDHLQRRQGDHAARARFKVIGYRDLAP
jgi:hypothetical protein